MKILSLLNFHDHCHAVRTQMKVASRGRSILGGALAFVLCCQASAQASNIYLLDPNYTGTEGAPFGSYAGAYRLITDALASTGGVPAGASATNPNILSIAPGTYNTAITTGASLSYSRANVALIGQTGNPDDVVITSTLDAAYNPGSGALGTTGSATLQLKGNNQSALNITFANSTDTPYIVNTGHKAVTPGGDYTTGNAQTATSQGVALLLQGDQQAFQNCKFLGYQDTLYTKGGRSYFKNCTVSGDIDFIFANGTTVFRNSTINMDGDHAGGDIIAPSTDKRTSNGIVFLNSTVTANSVHGNPVIDSKNAANASGPAASSMSLGRPWGWTQTGGDASGVFINTILPTAIKPAGWLAWDSTETAGGRSPGLDSRFAEFNSTSDGITPVDVTGRVTWSHQLTSNQAAAYTEANLFSFEAQYPWYGQGFPAGDASAPGTGSANPGDPNYSWPAYWGDRNTQNETTNSLVTGNPTAYTDPSWTVTGAWDPNAQLAASVPEPGTIVMMGIGSVALVFVQGMRRACSLASLIDPRMTLGKSGLIG
jgi:pectinesterase